MRFSDLEPAIIDKIRALRYDKVAEKHEGPWHWKSLVERGELEFLTLYGYNVLLPVGPETRPNISALRCIVSQDKRVLTLFLKDTTYKPSPEEEMFYFGRLAICEQMTGAGFYIATVYHDWYIVENEGLERTS